MMLFSNNKFYSPVESGAASGFKRLVMVRHAKSSWDIGHLNDFDRPLNERGKKDAPEMAKRLVNKKIKIDAFVSSTATRAKKTAGFFCDAYGRKDSDIILMQELYHAPAELITQLVKGFKNEYQTVAVFSHNPGITDFVNQLVKNIRLDNLPTCGVFAVTAATDKWSDFEKAEKKLWFFDYPKSMENERTTYK